MTIGLIGNIQKSDAKKVADKIISYLKEIRHKYLVQETFGKWLIVEGSKLIESTDLCPDSTFVKKADMIISLGGDGTMLWTSRIVGSAGIPILGINLGKLGFLADVSVEKIQECIEDVINNNYDIDERVVIELYTQVDEKNFYALNDVVIDRGASSRIIALETFVNDEYLITYTADGLIITTPTGSTAYSLATGGPIVVPQAEVFVINPIAPHTLTARPVVIPNDSIVKIKVSTPGKIVHMTVDGQQEKFYNTPVEFIVKKASYKVKLVRLRGNSYFELLRTKLMWGQDIRLGKV